MERLRSEVIEEYFFETQIWDFEGRIIPASLEVINKFEELKDDWMARVPRLPLEVPCVSLYPRYKGEKQGYVVSATIIYKPSSIPEDLNPDRQKDS